jgi:hypothetical protein
LLTFACAALAQEETPIVYQIKNVYRNADLDEKAIERFKNNIDLRSERDEIMKLFKPVKGRYKVIVFMASSYGLSFMNKFELFHNVLILKVDKNNEILDGLEYILEWAEPPHTARFVRAMKKGIKLRKGLNIQQLDFRTFETDFRENFKFGDFNGILDNLHDFKEIF